MNLQVIMVLVLFAGAVFFVVRKFIADMRQKKVHDGCDKCN